MDLPVGTVLGETYRISRLIGIGGMGAIYEAAHIGAGKRVAIKMMSRELAAHPEALARFRREGQGTRGRRPPRGGRRRFAPGGRGRAELPPPHFTGVGVLGPPRSGGAQKPTTSMM